MNEIFSTIARNLTRIIGEVVQEQDLDEWEKDKLLRDLEAAFAKATTRSDHDHLRKDERSARDTVLGFKEGPSD